MKTIFVLLTSLSSFAFAAGTCDVKSPEMNAVKACYSGRLYSIESEARFQETTTVKTQNYCFNTLVRLNEFGEDPSGRSRNAEIQVWRDNEKGNINQKNFLVPPGPINGANYSLTGVQGKCFVTKAENTCGKDAAPLGVSVSKDGIQGFSGSGIAIGPKDTDFDRHAFISWLAKDAGKRLEAAPELIGKEKNAKVREDIEAQTANCATQIYELIDKQNHVRKKEEKEIVKPKSVADLYRGKPKDAPATTGSSAKSEDN